jgi:hypothetical protein
LRRAVRRRGRVLGFVFVDGDGLDVVLLLVDVGWVRESDEKAASKEAESPASVQKDM